MSAVELPMTEDPDAAPHPRCQDANLVLRWEFRPGWTREGSRGGLPLAQPPAFVSSD